MSKNGLFIILAAMVFSGCTIKSGLYKPDFNAINDLKDRGIGVMAVKRGMSQNQAVNTIDIRSSDMVSPYGGDFEEYLETALKEHLISAKLLDQNSPTVVTTVLLKNELSTGAITGTADIAAKFIVHKEGRLVYEKIQSTHHEWDSSFAANVAVPNAVQNYPIAIQKLINALMSDEDFLTQVKNR